MKKRASLLCVGLAAACLTVVAVSRATGGKPALGASESAAVTTQRVASVTPYTLVQLLATLDEEAATEDELKADPDFVREESVLGQRVLVARRMGGDAARYREVWRAPALQNFELKTVAASALGTEVTEPVELRIGEPDDAVFRRLARLPRSFARFEERIREAERRGETELAERLRHRLERARR